MTADHPTTKTNGSVHRGSTPPCGPARKITAMNVVAPIITKATMNAMSVSMALVTVAPMLGLPASAVYSGAGPRSQVETTTCLAAATTPESLSSVLGCAPIGDVCAHSLAWIRICLNSLVKPLPPFTDIGIAGLGAFHLNPSPKSAPCSPNPATNHTIKHAMVDDVLIHHAAPHFARAVYC